MNTAIIVAAGRGERFSATQPKQFTEVLGKPLIIHTLERFEACTAIDEIVLVLSDEGREVFDGFRHAFVLPKLNRIVAGGSTRAASVRKGLDAIEPSTADILAVHDGARPLVTPDEIDRVIHAAGETGAACLVGEVTDTIKEIGDGKIIRTIDRERLRRALTPQAFRYRLLCDAFEKGELNASVTDECSMVERMGVAITLVEGGSQNIKVTRREDLILAAALLGALLNENV